MSTLAAATTQAVASELRSGSRVWRFLIQFSLVALAFLLACNEISDYDIWWHLRTGQLIPERGIPNTDWYSFTSSDRPWIDVHWGFQLIAATIHSFGGVPGLVILQACVIASTMAIALTAYRRAWSVWPQFCVMVVAILVMSSRFYVRPEIFTLLFTSIYLTVLLHAEERPRLLWILPLVQVLWANVQSLFVFGPILVGMYWAEVILRGRSYKGDVRHLMIVTGLVGAACIVSPYGIWNVMFLADVWQKMDPEAGQYYRATIGELKDVRSFLAEGGWQSGGIYILFLMMFLGAVGVVVRWREILLRREVFRLLPVIAFTWLGLQAMRNASHFALVVGIITAWNLGPSFPRKTTEFRPALVAILLSLFVGVYFVGGRLSEWLNSHRRFGFGTHPEQFSFEAMRICSLPGMPDRAAIFHMGHAANYIYACGPDRKVLMDPRLEVHTEQTLRDYRNLEGELETGANGTRMLDRFGINLVVAGCEHNIRIQATLFSSPAWKCVHWDPIAAVFVRSTLKLPPGVEEFDFRRGLFDGQPVVEVFPSFIDPWAPRNSMNQVESMRLFQLAQSLAGVANVNETLVRRVAWRSVRRTQRTYSIEANKIAARSKGIIAMFERGSSDNQETVYPLIFRGEVISELKRVCAADPNDIVSGFYLQQLFADSAALDGSISVLSDLSKHSASNDAQRSMMPHITQLYQSRKQLVDDPARQPPRVIKTWGDLKSFHSLGRMVALGTILESPTVEQIKSLLIEEQRNELTGWLRGADIHIELLSEFVNNKRAKIDEELLFLSQQIRTEDRQKVMMLIQSLELVGMADSTPAQRKILARFRDLLIDEPNKR